MRATDVSIDVQQVSLVINYDLPQNMDNYLHWIGPSSRSGRKGVASNFATDNDVRSMRRGGRCSLLMRFIGTDAIGGVLQCQG